MSVSARRDPVRAFNFHVSLMDATSGTGAAVTSIVLTPLIANPLAGFSECSGLEMTLETDDCNEGGNNGTVLKFPKRMKYGEITLKKGVTRSTELFDWFYGFTQGVGKRKDGVITLRDANRKAHTVWGFRRGLPTKYAGPQMNAMQSAVAIESITITHEGLYMLAGAAGLAAAVKGAADAIGSLF
ncbi:MAG: phage tail protein [Burkholderiales bacterium]